MEGHGVTARKTHRGLEQSPAEPPNTGDDWRLVRDAASAQLRLAAELYAACRAGEWSHPVVGPVIQESGLDAAGSRLQPASKRRCGVTWASGRMANAQAAVVLVAGGLGVEVHRSSRYAYMFFRKRRTDSVLIRAANWSLPATCGGGKYLCSRGISRAYRSSN